MIEAILDEKHQAFQTEVRDFLDEALTPAIRLANAQKSTVFLDRDLALAWQRKLHEKGWVTSSWPVEHGGVDWTPLQRFIFATESARAGAPSLVPLGLNMVAPVILRFGTEAQKAHYLPRILSGEDYWCQGYSEPGSGSDLASLRCRARSDGDDYIVDGTKIWTTHAHFANRIFCLVRTSSEARPQQGITFLLIDMDTPGVSVEPIMSLGGDHEVNQVFFDSVRVPKANVVGEEGQGWTCAKYLLEFERGGNIMAAGIFQSLRHLEAIARQEPDGRGGYMINEPWVRRALARLEIRVHALEMTELRIVLSTQTGGSVGPESSLLKTEFTELEQDVTELAIKLVGPSGLLFDRRRPLHEHLDNRIGPEYLAPLLPEYFNTRAASIYGGTNEIQRTLIARMLLRL